MLVDEVTSRASISELVFEWTLCLQAQFALRSTGRDPGGFEERLPELRRRAGARGAVRFQMVQDFSNDFLFGNEGYHAEGAPALTFQRVG